MPHQLMKSEARRGGRRRALVPVSGLFAVAILSACASSPSVPPNVGVTINDVTESPADYEGYVVTVSGEINRIYGPRMFSIGGDDFFDGDELLVVGNSTLPSLVEQGDESDELLNDIVQVRGIVRMFAEAQTDLDLGIARSNLELEDIDGNTPILIASEIDITARTDVVPVNMVSNGDVALDSRMPDSVIVDPVVDAIVIVDAPDRMALAGRAAALIGAKVLTVVSDHAFWIGPGPGRQLFVKIKPNVDLNDEHMKIEPGQTVAVAGVLRPLPMDLTTVQSEWSLSGANIATLQNEMIYLDAVRTVVMQPMDSATGMSTKP